MKIHMSPITLGSLGRGNVLMGAAFGMLRFSAIRTAISGSDWKLKASKNQRSWMKRKQGPDRKCTDSVMPEAGEGPTQSDIQPFLHTS